MTYRKVPAYIRRWWLVVLSYCLLWITLPIYASTEEQCKSQDSIATQLVQNTVTDLILLVKTRRELNAGSKADDLTENLIYQHLVRLELNQDIWTADPGLTKLVSVGIAKLRNAWDERKPKYSSPGNGGFRSFQL